MSEGLWRTASVDADPAGGLELGLLLDAISPERREAFLLTQIVGLTYVEAADVVGVPVGTIRSRVARARDDLAADLGRATG